ncbi:hypothetical protein [Micromonospora phytophila]|nr:hypothetical protein [Micromonospora phytophila]
MKLDVETLPGHLVERTERLVEQEHVGAYRQRARDGHTLTHAA